MAAYRINAVASYALKSTP